MVRSMIQKKPRSQRCLFLSLPKLRRLYERHNQEYYYTDRKDADCFDLQKHRLWMLQGMKKIIGWILKHIYIRTVDLQSKPDDMSLEEVKPKKSLEIGLRGTF